MPDNVAAPRAERRQRFGKAEIAIRNSASNMTIQGLITSYFEKLRNLI